MNMLRYEFESKPGKYNLQNVSTLSSEDDLGGDGP